MPKVRLIPRLDIKGSNLVKGIHLEGLRVLGDPHAYARHYYEQGADEIVYIDAVASLYGRSNLVDIVRQTASDIFIPMAAGGGLRSLEDIREILRCGADKIIINTAAVANPELVKQAAESFGSSTVIVYISVKKRPEGGYEVYTENARQRTGRCPFEWASEVESLGAGEIYLESIDQEGTGSGFELTLANEVSSRVQIPVILAGGAGNREHLLEAVQTSEVSALSVGNLLHYHLRDEHPELKVKESGYPFNTKHIEKTDIAGIKQHLSEAGVPIRLA